MFNLPNGHQLSSYPTVNINGKKDNYKEKENYQDIVFDIPTAEPYPSNITENSQLIENISSNNQNNSINSIKTIKTNNQNKSNNINQIPKSPSRKTLPTYIIKVIFLGDTNTGKTFTLYSLQNNKLCPDTPMSTIGVEFASLQRNINNISIKYNIWDTAGQEKYRAITYSFFKNAGIAVLFFDLTNYSSFVSLRKWIDDIHKNCPDNVIIILVGNKLDLQNRQVSELEIKKFIECNNILNYTEISAKTGEGIETILLQAAEILYDKIVNKRIPPSNIAGIRTDQFVEVKSGKSTSVCTKCVIS